MATTGKIHYCSPLEKILPTPMPAASYRVRKDGCWCQTQTRDHTTV